MNKNVKRIMVLTLMAIFGISAVAFAGWGMGYGHMGLGNGEPGWHHRWGQGYSGHLSSDEFARLDRERAEFFKATENIRQNLYAKELELRGELAKENPDTSKASKLQSDISKLQSDLDQERLNYEIKARKSAPNYNRGRGGYGPMMGYGSHGSGYCWR
ncbi:MAG: periplasmic heavy metal sensor [Desulfobacterales bacterium]